MSESGWISWVFTTLIGEAVIWLSIRQATRNRRVSFFGLAVTREVDDPVKYRKIVQLYRVQMILFPVIAFFIVFAPR